MTPQRDMPVGGPLNARFAAALLDPLAHKPDEVVARAGKRADRRFDVYRNNVTFSLMRALADIFPAVKRIVGDRAFDEVAKAYVRANPPQVPMLFEYGRDFAGFLAAFAPLQRLAYLPDVARLERLWLDAYHAADAAPLVPQALGAVAPEQLGEVRFRPHPAAGLLDSHFAAFTIFSENRSKGPVGPIETRRPEAALVSRPGLEVQVLNLPEGGHAFHAALMAGATLAEAAAAGASASDRFDINRNIGGLIQSGAYCAILIEGETP